MTEKAHNITNLPPTAPEAPVDNAPAEAAGPKFTTRVKNFVIDKKLFFAGLGAGAAATAGVVYLATETDEDEVLVVEDPTD